MVYLDHGSMHRRSHTIGLQPHRSAVLPSPPSKTNTRTHET
jgi:hypothetical protein